MDFNLLKNMKCLVKLLTFFVFFCIFIASRLCKRSNAIIFVVVIALCYVCGARLVRWQLIIGA